MMSTPLGEHVVGLHERSLCVLYHLLLLNCLQILLRRHPRVAMRLPRQLCRAPDRAAVWGLRPRVLRRHGVGQVRARGAVWRGQAFGMWDVCWRPVAIAEKSVNSQIGFTLLTCACVAWIASSCTRLVVPLLHY
jgi:hypothetical protein